MSLTVEIEHHPTHTVARLIGSAGIAAVGMMDRHVNTLAAARPKLLILDMQRLEFLASLDLGLLVRLAHGIRDAGGKTFVAGARGGVADSFRRTRLDAVIPLVADVDAALHAAGVGGG